MVIGCAGTGKTTLASNLAQATGAPLICLDDLWPTDLTEADVPEFREIIQEKHSQDRWISDGNFSAATFDIRLPLATHIIWMEGSRAKCIWRSFKRAFRRGEAHQLKDLPKVIKFIWNFDRKNRPLIQSLIAKHGPNVPLIRNGSDSTAHALIKSRDPDKVN